MIDIQRSIGADIMMAFDECPPGDAPYDYAARSLDLTCRWLERCFDRYRQTEPKYGHYQSLFPIVQGCTYPDLRTRSAEFVRQFDADGYAIGGLAVGEPAPVMYEMIGLLDGLLPRDKPRYLMGVGTPANLLEGIERGVDMFDCVMPTRNGRNGMLFTTEGTADIGMREVEGRLFADRPGRDLFRRRGGCTEADLRHPTRSRRDDGRSDRIASLHNLSFYLWLVREARRHMSRRERSRAGSPEPCP